MKASSRLLILWLSCLPVLLTNAADPKTRLQEALFEEEVNRDLGKAMAQYRSLIDSFDQQRKFAATAIYRLGECHRKQGHTNEAAAYYQRVVREFADQTNLVTAASAHLRASPEAPSTGTTNTASVWAPLNEVFNDLAEIGRELSQIQTVEDFMANLEGDESPEVINATLKDATVSNILARMEVILPSSEWHSLSTLSDQQLRENLGDKPYREVESLLMQLEARTDAISAENDQRKQLLELKHETLQESLPLVQAMIVSRGNFLAGTNRAPATGRQDMAAPPASPELAAIARMIKESPDLLNAPYQGAGSPLEYAISKGQVAIARFILDSGAKVANRTRNGEALLSLAVASGNLAMTRLLLERGARDDQEALDRALASAAQRGFVEMTSTLLAEGADVNAVFDRTSVTGGPLFAAIAHGQLETLRVLMERDVNLDQTGPLGTTPLQLAASTRGPHDNAVLRLLIERGADVNRRDPSSEPASAPPLLRAVRRENDEGVKLLLAAGARPDVQDSRGATALHYAVGLSTDTALKLLLAQKADPNLEGVTEGWDLGPVPPLALALHYRESPLRIEVARQLLAAGAQPNVRIANAKAGSLIAMAIKGGLLNYARLLLDHGADPEFTPEEHLLFHAIDISRDADLVNRLIKAGADVNTSFDGLTPLLAALSRRDTNSIHALLEAKANPNQARANGQTPLDLVNQAIGAGTHSPAQAKHRPVYEQIRQMLLDAGASYINGDPDAITLIRKSNGVRWPILQRRHHPLSDFRLLEILALAYHSGRPPIDLNFPAWEKILVHRPKNGGYEATKVNAGQLITDTNLNDVPLRWGDVIEIPEEPHRVNEQWTLAQDLRTKLGKRLAREVTVDDGRKRITRKLYPLSPDLARVRFPSLTSTGYEEFGFDDVTAVTTVTTVTAVAGGAGEPANRSAWPSCWLRDIVSAHEDLMNYHDLTRVTVLRHAHDSEETRRLVFDMSPVKEPVRTLRMGGLEASEIKEKGLWLRDGDFIIIPNAIEKRTGDLPTTLDARGNPTAPRGR